MCNKKKQNKDIDQSLALNSFKDIEISAFTFSESLKGITNMQRLALAYSELNDITNMQILAIA